MKKEREVTMNVKEREDDGEGLDDGFVGYVEEVEKEMNSRGKFVYKEPLYEKREIIRIKGIFVNVHIRFK